ncbi:MAG: sugar ABC transporter ATP-binding protein [Acidimicrobiia bacterium]
MNIGGARVVLAGISKRFGATQALDNVSLDIEPGEIHALVGENGAGKSTLGKIIGGLYVADSGMLEVDGEQVIKWDPPSALAAGIVTIQQELSLVPARSVSENVFLGLETATFGVLRGSERQRYAALDSVVGFGIPPDVPVASLRLADQQKVEILRAVARDARLIVMDEPTSSLTQDEAELLHGVMSRLSEEGRTIVYVSHFLDEVLEVADRVTVMRDGVVKRTSQTNEETKDSLIEAMLGRSFDATFPLVPPLPANAPVVLEVTNLSGAVPKDISFEVRAGEIVGLAGLVGSGRTELARLLFGADRLSGGEIKMQGALCSWTSPSAAIAAGLAMLPEDRRGLGLVMSQNLRENVTLPRIRRFAKGGVIRRSEERSQVSESIRALNIVPPHVDGELQFFSGGNQQKALFAKWTSETPSLIVLDEPTRGVDVGAKRSIYKAITGVAAAGSAVILISSELEEVVHLSHRVLFMSNGRVVGSESAADLTVDGALRRLFAASTGGKPS